MACHSSRAGSIQQMQMQAAEMPGRGLGAVDDLCAEVILGMQGKQGRTVL